MVYSDEELVYEWQSFAKKINSELNIPIRKNGISLNLSFESELARFYLKGKNLWSNNIHNETFHQDGVMPKCIIETELISSFKIKNGLKFSFFPASIFDILLFKIFNVGCVVEIEKNDSYLLSGIKGKEYKELKDRLMKLVRNYGKMNVLIKNGVLKLKIYQLLNTHMKLADFYKRNIELTEIILKKK